MYLIHCWRRNLKIAAGIRRGNWRNIRTVSGWTICDMHLHVNKSSLIEIDSKGRINTIVFEGDATIIRE